MERREGQRGQPEDERLHRTLAKIHQRLKAIYEVTFGVQHPQSVLRILNVYPGSELFSIADPGSTSKNFYSQKIVFKVSEI
jgi:hypothetical protein